ncbi:MAG: hypothetical protein AAFX99_13175, partial [Myxococcota bacterium]
PSQGFQVIAPQNASDVLAPGEERIYQVRFRPTALRNDDATNYGNAVVVLTNDPERPEVNIELSGVAIPDPEQCLTFEVNAIDFGFVETGNISAETVTLSNCGEADVDVTSIGVEGSSAFTISFGGQLPRTLEPNARLTVIVNYTPEGPEEVQSVVTADSDGGTATLVATGGTTCPSAIALAQAEGQQPSDERIEGLVDSEFVFNGFLSSDPAGSELEYTWVVNAPEGSDDLQIDPNLESERFTMRPDVPGTYTAELSVRSTISGLESCSVSTITAVAFEEQLPVASVTLTWDSQADLDLHIVRSDSEGNFSDWGSGQQFNPEDIYFANLSPDFGEEGVDFDNPRHLGDDTNGNGPETIEFPSLEANRNYRIGINYARNRLGSDATNAEVTITLGESEPVVLTAELEEEGVFWIPAVLNGNGTVTPINEFE